MPTESSGLVTKGSVLVFDMGCHSVLNSTPRFNIGAREEQLTLSSSETESVQSSEEQTQSTEVSSIASVSVEQAPEIISAASLLSSLPDSLVMDQIWPRLPLTVSLMWCLRRVNRSWRDLVGNSKEWF